MKGFAVKLWRTVQDFVKKLGLVRTVAIVLAVAILLVAGNILAPIIYLPASAFSKSAQKGLAEAGETISNNSGEVLVAQKNGTALYVDTATLNLRIEDSASGRSINTLSGNDILPNRVKSPIVISFRSSDGQISEWDAWQYSISTGQYKIEKIENGVRFELTLSQGDSYSVGDYLPEKISPERYEAKFLDEIEKLEAGDKAEQATSYKKVLSMFYRFDDDENCYYMAYKNTPARSIMLILIDMVKEIGYTQEDIIKDSEDFGLTVSFTNPVRYTVYLEHTLEDGSLLVNIPSYLIECDNAACTLESISLYPALGCADGESNEGFLFVPDGSGMLMKMDTASMVYSDYSRQVYDNGRYGAIYNDPHYSENFYMPCFGLYHTGGESVGMGFFSVIEAGAENARINTTLKHTDANAEGGNLYNAVYTTFDMVQSANVKVFGAFSTKSAQYRVVTDSIDADYQVRYYFLFENADYYTFANIYKDYLGKSQGIEYSYDNSAKIFINLLGAISVEDSAMGVLYERTLPLTSYKQALEIYEQLSDINAVYNYRWVLNGGRNSSYGGNADAVSVCGNKSDLELLLSNSKAGNEIFIEANLMRLYSKNSLISNRHLLVGFDGDVLTASDSYYPDGTLNLEKPYNNYNLLHPSYLLKTTERFLKNSTWFDSVCLTDFGSTYYASYGSKTDVSGQQANLQAVIPALQNISEQKTVALNNPNGDKLVYCDYAVGISRESSQYGVYYASVPFRQLVMNGITAYTTLNVNMAQSSPRYFMLQALELNSIPQYTLAAEKVDELIKAGVSDYYSVTFDDIKSDMLEFYDEYSAARAEIGSGEIAGHEIISENVFLTTYSNGVRVLVNYNLHGVEVDGVTLEPQGYHITKG